MFFKCKTNELLSSINKLEKITTMGGTKSTPTKWILIINEGLNKKTKEK
ncbi:hypothetical protein OIU84_028484, partial [Salix udensis]